MSPGPAVSVIIPAYNTAGYIDRCLDSVLGQSLRNIEVIVVDDGSTDDTAARIETHAEPRLILLRKANGGPSSAKNLGLDRARGEFVLLLDSDDWLEHTCLEEMVAKATADGLDIVGSDAWYDYPGKPPLHWPSSPPASEWTSRESVLRDVLAMRNASWMATRLYRRALFEEHQLRYDEQIHYSEDRLLDLVLFHHARKVAKLDRAYLHYVQRPGSLTNRKDIDFFSDIAAHDAIVEFMSRHGLVESHRTELDYLEYRTVFISLVRASPDDPRHAGEFAKIATHIAGYADNPLVKSYATSMPARTRWLALVYRIDYRLGCRVRRAIERARSWRSTASPAACHGVRREQRSSSGQTRRESGA